MQQRSSVLTEIAWLALFLVIFAVLVYAFNLILVPHHFNDKIAIMLAAVFAGVVMILTRAYAMRRKG